MLSGLEQTIHVVTRDAVPAWTRLAGTAHVALRSHDLSYYSRRADKRSDEMLFGQQ